MKLIHKIGLGSVQFGIPYGISNQNGTTSENEVKHILEFAIKSKINIIDTASAYGNSEVVLGNNDLKLFKVVSKFMPPSLGKTVTDQLNESLINLRIESLYGYLAHRPSDILQCPTIWEELKGLKQLNKIEKIGFSLNNPEELEDLLSNGFKPDLIQVPYNYLDNRFKRLLIDLHRKGCEIHSRSTFLQGLFFTSINSAPDFFNPIKDIVCQLQVRYGVKLSSTLLHYVAGQSFIDYVIVGVENKAQLANNILGLKEAEILPTLEHHIPSQILTPSLWPINKL